MGLQDLLGQFLKDEGGRATVRPDPQDEDEFGGTAAFPATP